MPEEGYICTSGFEIGGELLRLIAGNHLVLNTCAEQYRQPGEISC